MPGQADQAGHTSRQPGARCRPQLCGRDNRRMYRTRSEPAEIVTRYRRPGRSAARMQGRTWAGHAFASAGGRGRGDRGPLTSFERAKIERVS